MDPISLSVMAGLSMAATAVGGAVSAAGQMAAGVDKQRMMNYQAAVAKINQQHAIDVGEAEAEKSGMRTRAQLGEIASIQGASNLDVNSGSGLAVRKSQLALGYLDERTIRNNAAWRAFSDKTQADLDTAAGKEARTSGFISGVGTLIGTAGSVASKWAQMGSSFGVPGQADPSVALYNQGGSAGAVT